MRFLSVCSGIEAASVASAHLGWKAAGFAEIDPFCCSLLKEKYPHVKNYGDFTSIRGDELGPVDLVCGGTPCQDFSVAGKRAGLDGARGNLTLEFVRLVERVSPRWVFWENVPGVLSIDGGRAFGAFLGALGQLGYGVAWRVLDAQYFGVPQRRKRVFVVGYFGDWRPAAAVLFESESVRGNSPPSREAGQRSAPCLNAGPTSGGRTYGTCADSAESLIPQGFTSSSFGGYDTGCGSLRAAGGDYGGGTETIVAQTAMCLNAKGGGGRMDVESETFVAHALRADGFDASEDGTGRGTPIVPFDLAQITSNVNRSSARPGDPMPPLCSGGQPHVAGMGVRRLTPIECEALQGFPRDYTLIRHRGKPAADGPRYKALGNSWAVPVVRWCFERMEAVDAIMPTPR